MRTKQEINRLKALLEAEIHHPDTPIEKKIELQGGLDAIDWILAGTDAL